MNLDTITPLILTWNEEANLRSCLEQLTWARRIVVVDSGSTDRTLDICDEFSNLDVLIRPFDNHTTQWNHALDHAGTRWVLSLDADYVINDAFVEELKAIDDAQAEAAWYAGFQFRIFGRPLRGTLYPPRAVFFDRESCRYVADGHTQLLQIRGSTGMLKTRIIHDDRKPLSRWLDSQWKYACLEAAKLEAESHPASLPDRLRKMIWPAAPAAFLYTLFVKGVILDGWPGWFYVLQRTYAELVLSLILLERRLFRG